MSVLLIDVGNTRIKWSWFDQIDLGSDSAKSLGKGVVTHRDVPRHSVQASLEEQWGAMSISEAGIKVWIASVGDSALGDMINAICQQLWAVQTTAIKSESAWADLRNGYAEPSQLGVDRWMAVVAAYHRYPDSNVLIIDAGSSVTVDAISADGQHLGGAIFPGYILQRKSLNQDTANLEALSQHEVSGEDKAKGSSVMPFANDTKAAIGNGIDASIVGAIEYFIQRMEQALASKRNFALKVLITGGDAERIMAISESSFEYCPDLVLAGMMLSASSSNRL